ncbi:HTH domain-containing protein [Aquimarina sp. AU119]|uniref:HTH domain-containing protein n=1 Tax=Aquimarina sp. AU119 TaxID=2108528 RepID=UPI000D68D472|nr:HTH domain-containing protein [Aquimarina sp. AU119]
MKVIIKQIELIERIDQLVRLQATGSPGALAARLGISRTNVYRLIDTMRDLNAPVEYNHGMQSFVYEKEVKFSFGFVTRELSQREAISTYGGTYLKNTIFTTAYQKMVRRVCSIVA